MKWFNLARRKQLLRSMLVLGMALFPLWVMAQDFEMREIFPGNLVAVFTKDPFTCKNSELDIEVHWANNEERTAGVAIYKREEHGIALVEYLKKQPYGWQIMFGFFAYKSALEDHMLTHLNEKLLEEFFPDAVVNPMTEKIQTKKCE